MTRINLVPPSALTDQHLFSEFREIKMIPKSLARSLQAALKREIRKGNRASFSVHGLQAAQDAVYANIPKAFCLGAGHVSFFYNKGAYLRLRYAVIRIELAKRGVKFNEESEFDPDGVFDKLPEKWNQRYTPTDEALFMILQRIEARIAKRPTWYRKTAHSYPATATQA